MKKFLTLSIFTFISTLSYSQHNHVPENPIMCSEHIQREKFISQNSEYRIQDSIDQVNFELSYQQYLTQYSANDRSIYTVPVVVHIVHLNGIENISNAQVHDAIEKLNADFNMVNSDLNNTVSAFSGITGNPNVEFKLATKDPNGNCHSGITRTVSSTTYDTGGLTNHPIVQAVAAQHGVWPSSKYMSVFVCIDPNGSAGYTFRPSNIFPSSQMYGAIFMRHDYMGTIETASSLSRHTLSHEVGHWLNLAHLWGPTNNPGIASSCSTDDNVSDTPNTIGWSSCNLSGTTCNSLDNVQNIMEYSYCSTMFTSNQAARMQAALQSFTAGRNQLITNSNLSNTGVLIPSNNICSAEFTTNTNVICAGASIDFSDISVHNITNRNWTFPGGTPSTSTSASVAVVYNTPGIYSVTLEVFNSSNNQTTTETNIITVMNDSGYVFPYFEGFENQPNFPNNIAFTVFNPANDNTWEVTNNYGSTGNSSLVLKNYTVTNPTIDEFISGTINLGVLSASDDFQFSFKYAYKKKFSGNTESLRFYISKDCGVTWSLRKSLSGNILNNLVEFNYFNPTVQDWKTVDITSIPSSYFVPNFRYRFKFESDGGNNIYIDDINLSSSTYVSSVNIEDVNSKLSHTLYPNPVSESSIIKLEGYANNNLLINIYDISGKYISSVFDGQITNDLEIIQIDSKVLSKGIYYIKLIGENSSETIKLVKE